MNLPIELLISIVTSSLYLSFMVIPTLLVINQLLKSHFLFLDALRKHTLLKGRAKLASCSSIGLRLMMETTYLPNLPNRVKRSIQVGVLCQDLDNQVVGWNTFSRKAGPQISIKRKVVSMSKLWYFGQTCPSSCPPRTSSR